MASLAGWFTSTAWGLAIVLSYVIKDEEGRPRKPPIAAIVGGAMVIESLLMVFVRI